MIPNKLPNATATKITVTGTATLLQSLIETAGGEAFPMNTNNTLYLTVEGDDIRVAFDGNVPTSSKGLKLTGSLTLNSVPLDKLYLITTGSNSLVSIQLGKTILTI